MKWRTLGPTLPGPETVAALGAVSSATCRRTRQFELISSVQLPMPHKLSAPTQVFPVVVVHLKSRAVYPAGTPPAVSVTDGASSSIEYV